MLFNMFDIDLLIIFILDFSYTILGTQLLMIYPIVLIFVQYLFLRKIVCFFVINSIFLSDSLTHPEKVHKN